MDVSECLKIASSMIAVTAIFLYYLQVKSRESVPDLAVVASWVAVNLVNCFSYFEVVGGDLLQWVITLVVTIGLSVLLVYIVVAKKHAPFRGLSTVASILLGGLVLSAIVGLVMRDLIWVNISLQLGQGGSFVPVVYGVLTGKLQENRVRSWAAGQLAYVVLIVATVLSDDFRWIALVFPVAVFLGNGSVALAILWKLRQKKRK